MKLKPGWRHVKLSDIAKIKSGSTPLRAEGERYFSTAGTPWVKTLDLNNGEIISTDEKITDTALLETSCSVFPVGTVLVAMYGGFNQIGRTGLLTIPAAINQALSGLILDRDKAEPAYILNYLNGNVKLWKKFAASSRKDPNITRDDVCGFPVLLPPLAEQKKIAKILSTWDNAISVTEKLLANSQKQKKALMQQLLTGKKRLLDENGTRFSETWKLYALSKLFQRVTTKNNGKSNNVVTISGQHGLIKQEDFFKKTVASDTLDGYFLLKKGQFAYNKSYSNGYPMGAIKRLNRYPEGVVTTLYICFELTTPKKSCGDYWEHYFESGLLNNSLSQIAHEGGRAHGLLNVKPSDFFSLKVAVPGFEEQQKIASVLSAADTEISTLEKKLACLKDEKKALMQQLLTGKRRVKVDEAVAV
ncbi:restriction endonuclease subunit S [Escherichia coli]|uniref:restriction endonuclease subunit S n=1 Tax=Escherichia coli TaxID=562 RepID=UPI000DE254A0|nr:restriction endonuclease subunit S [Escherichia coli]MBB8931026.1 restriction endonuclease subunit S [Escherichia coli]RDA01389.1 restriction endonuclease subunit S [Escherichia coli]HCL9884650.1 restriction endonuclease subunit S [Escherichia coli]HCL9932465.1 restriction endonuclease subunit S [Escherichia coli]